MKSFDPNYIYRFSKKTIKLTFQQWEYLGIAFVEIGGNCTFADMLSDFQDGDTLLSLLKQKTSKLDFDFVINGLQLEPDFFRYGDATFYLTIDTHFSERVDVINLTNMPIKQSTIKQLKEDQKKHGYKELTTMIADVLEKHYEKD